MPSPSTAEIREAGNAVGSGQRGWEVQDSQFGLGHGEFEVPARSLGFICYETSTGNAHGKTQ